MLFRFRHLKRCMLTGGYSAPVYQFLKELRAETSSGSFQPTDGQFLVNLSFDLELGFNSPLWERDPREAIYWGEIAKRNFLSTLAFLKKENIPCNVQIVGGLLDRNFFNESFVAELQRKYIQKHESLYQLSQEEQRTFTNELIELGIHGFSHRRFNTLLRDEADREIKKSIACVDEVFQKRVRFMSFPKNNIAHTGVLKENGIFAWRSDCQNVSLQGEVPIGLWFSPGNTSPHDLSRLLPEIKKLRPNGYFLHLWNHFTETDDEILADMIAVIRNNGFSFTTVQQYIGYI